jgi:DNA-binding MarR family transcriptional regulator
MEPLARPEETWTKFATSVFRINGALIRAGEGISRPVGQSSARWQVLGRAHEPQTVAAMARDLGHARQSVQRVADVLEREGLVAYKDNPHDRRARLVELTPAGREVLTAIYRRQVGWSLNVMAALPVKGLAAITDALNEIVGVLEADTEKRAESDVTWSDQPEREQQKASPLKGHEESYG